MNRIYKLVTFFFLLTLCVTAQVPTTNIFVFDIAKDGKEITLNNPKYLTEFNSNGYNNQPNFFGDNSLYMSSDYKASVNTEIYELNLSARKLQRVTSTTQSEYSPTKMPDGKHFSVIRQSNKGNNDQLLWKYPIDRTHEGNAIISNLTNVGYHAWLGDSKVIMFLVGEPHNLVEYDLTTEKQEIVAEDIGRSMHRKGDFLYFIQKISRKFWYLKAYNFVENTMETVTQTLREKEDFVIMDDGTFLMSSGAFLFAYHPEQDAVWRKVYDFKNLGLNKVTRLALSDNKIAVVNVSE